MRAVVLRACAVLLAAALVAVGVVGYEVYTVARSVPALFRRNTELKAQGFYMAEFEFKMLAGLKLLSDGAYSAAYTTLRRIGREMATTEGLVRVPAGATPDERMDFLLARQDPTTGAFMDARYPSFTYIAPTLNALEALDALSHQTGRPLRLRYPLRFLDDIATPESLRRHLDGLLYLSRFWARVLPSGPGPYGPGVSELAYFDVFEDTAGYRFSPEWRETFRAWLDATQDPETGMWGQRIGDARAWTQRPDANATFHILAFVLTPDGANRDAAHPLRHAERLAASLLPAVAAAMPDGADAQHQWGLEQTQATQILTRLLWPHLDAATRAEVRSRLTTALAERYRLFRRTEGGFALYGGSAADLDGTGTALGLIEAVGSLPGTATRRRLWGDAAGPQPVVVPIRSAAEMRLPATSDATSFRLYAGPTPPADDLDDQRLIGIVYPPGGGQILDVMDLRQSLWRYLKTGKQDFGNWTTKAALRAAPIGLAEAPRPVPVAIDGRLSDIVAPENGRDPAPTVLVGYDALQIPVSATLFVPDR
jgi:hypothetical protein